MRSALRITLRSKLLGGLLLLSFTFVATALMGFSVLERERASMDALNHEARNVRRVVAEIRENVDRTRLLIYEIIVQGGAGSPFAAIARLQESLIRFELLSRALALGSDSQAFKSHLDGITYRQWAERGLEREFSIRFSAAQNTAHLRETQRSFDEFAVRAQRILKRFRLAYNRSLAGLGSFSELLDRSVQHDMIALRFVDGKINEVFERMLAASRNEGDRKARELQEYGSRLMYGMLVGWLVVIALGTWLTWFFWKRAFLAPLAAIEETLTAVGAGELDRRFDSARGDELGNLALVLNQMTERIQRSYELAVEASRAKSEFLANMSHEIRTPLNGIVSLGELLAESALSPEQAEDLRDLRACADTLRHLLTDVLDVSKIEAGKLVIDNSPFKLRKLLAELESVFEARARQSGMELVLHVEESVPETIVSDGLRIRQCLGNLLDNCIKFSNKRGGIVLYVAARGSELVFSVCDSGVGIPPERQTQIFESFTQVDGSISRKFGGVGLGLTIVRSLVGMMGGRMTCASDPRAGSRFELSIPLVRAPDEQIKAAAISRSESPGEGPGSAGPRSPRLLVVDDNQLNREVLSRLLELHGYEVIRATSGEQAVDLARETRFDAILMDISMGEGIDGLEACRRLKERGSASIASPVVPFTAFATVEMQERCLAAGMEGFLTKPLDMDKVLQKIAALLA